LASNFVVDLLSAAFFKEINMFKRISVFAIAISIGAVSPLKEQLRALTAGQKYKIKGVVIRKK
jgi:hypothetical protein